MTEQQPQRPQVLSDHKRDGKRLVPPLMLDFPIRLNSWTKDRLPELLWTALLNDSVGWKEGAALTLAIARAAKETQPVDPESPGPLWIAASDFALLADAAWAQVAAALGANAIIVAQSLNALSAYYPSFPMMGLNAVAAHAPIQDDRSLEHLERVVHGLFDRTSIPAVRAQANAVYVAFATERLSVAPETSLANFNEVERYPDTELSRQVGAAVRSSMQVMLSGFAGDEARSWPAEFWRCGLSLGACR